MINIRIQTQFWSIVLFLPIFFITLNCSSHTNRITNFDSRKDQIREKYINDGSLAVFSADIDRSIINGSLKVRPPIQVYMKVF